MENEGKKKRASDAVQERPDKRLHSADVSLTNEEGQKFDSVLAAFSAIAHLQRHWSAESAITHLCSKG
jgi:hypothetical protein